MTNATKLDVSKIPAKARFSLRCKPANIQACGQALGVELPLKIGTVNRAESLEVLALGPDEWLILADMERMSAIEAAFQALYPTAPHSLVELSAREITYAITGAQASVLLTLGCPRDLDKLPVAQARRTIFDGVTVILWRDEENAYRMDVWRSFEPHVKELLAVGCKELAAA